MKEHRLGEGFTAKSEIFGGRAQGPPLEYSENGLLTADN
jgi:hypothetical protein